MLPCSLLIQVVQLVEIFDNDNDDDNDKMVMIMMIMTMIIKQLLLLLLFFKHSVQLGPLTGWVVRAT